MAVAIILFLILSAASCAVEAQSRHPNISPGSTLTPTTSWRSPSGVYAFGFYQQGNGYAVGVFIAGIPELTVVWTANRNKPPTAGNVTLNLTGDHGVILQQPQTHAKYIIRAGPISGASMLDSGNFVLYNSIQQIIWQSFSYPTDTILPGQRLLAGMELFSSVSETDHSTGIFRLKMQTDGNLVQYPVNTPDTAQYSNWASATWGIGDTVTLNLDENGRLYLLNATGANIRNLFEGKSATEETVYLTRIDVDGIFRVYSRTLNPKGNWSVLWKSTDDPCSSVGICGLNGFCDIIDNKTDCKCLPGFSVVNPGNWTSGCERNFVGGGCKDRSIKYTMSRLDNISFIDDSDSVPQLNSIEECENSCLHDCNCDAVLHKNGQCIVQQLPMRNVRISTGYSSNVVFIKVATSDQNEKEVRLDILLIGVSLVAFALMVLAASRVLKQYYNYNKPSREVLLISLLQNSENGKTEIVGLLALIISVFRTSRD